MHQDAILPTGGAARYHALDGLRAAMMLLGIYLHVAVAYATIGGWPYKQAELTGSLNLTIVVIHLFRMPVFYLMAGFFAALLYERRGLRKAAANRVGRIVVPFVVGWIILYALVVALVVVGKGGMAATLASLPPAPWWSRLHPMHLWFLEYLLVFYVLAVIVVPAVAALPVAWREVLNRAFRAIVQSPGGLIVLAVPSFFALLPMRHAGFDDPRGFVPEPHIVAAYAIPFFVGWLLYRNADLLELLRRHAWTLAAAGAIGTALWLVLTFNMPDRGFAFMAKCAAHSLALWGVIFGVTGLFLRYLSRPSAVWRYLCDSSYFLYLAHMPVVMAFQLLLEPLAVSPLLKVPVVLAATTVVLLVMYHYTVRPTFIGATLNGRRYPIGAPPAVAASA